MGRLLRKDDKVTVRAVGECKIIHASKDGKFLTVALPGGRVLGINHPTGRKP